MIGDEMRKAKWFIVSGVFFVMAVAFTVIGKTAVPGPIHDNFLFVGGLSLGGAIAEFILTLYDRKQPKEVERRP